MGETDLGWWDVAALRSRKGSAFLLRRHVTVLFPREESHRQHPETPGQGGGTLHDDDQRADAEQGTRGHDHVCCAQDLLNYVPYFFAL